MHDFDFDHCNRPRSNVNMPIESQYRNFYFMVTVMLSLSVIIYEIFAVEICITLTMTLVIDQGKM